GVDPAVSEVADQEVVAEPAKVRGRHRQAPGRVQVVMRDKPLEKVAVGVEDIDEAAPGSGNVIVGVLVLHGIGDEDSAADILNAEGRETVLLFRSTVRQ